jgi:hypothetical protein
MIGPILHKPIVHGCPRKASRLSTSSRSAAPARAVSSGGA